MKWLAYLAYLVGHAGWQGKRDPWKLIVAIVLGLVVLAWVLGAVSQ